MSHKTTVANDSKITATSVTEKSPANPLNRAIAMSFTLSSLLYISVTVFIPTILFLKSVWFSVEDRTSCSLHVLQMPWHKNEAASG